MSTSSISGAPVAQNAPHYNSASTIFEDTVGTIAISALSIFVASTCERSLPFVAIILYAVPVIASVIWLLRRCGPSGNYVSTPSWYPSSFWYPRRPTYMRTYVPYSAPVHSTVHHVPSSGGWLSSRRLNNVEARSSLSYSIPAAVPSVHSAAHGGSFSSVGRSFTHIRPATPQMPSRGFNAVERR